MLRSVFVSSTFQDMHGERDAIRTKVTPTVNAMAEKYGESVATCDLRWGVDTSEMSEEGSARKVLDVCLDEIDRCRPYMIVILGYRYGWIPGRELIKGAVHDKDGFSLSDADISVTALEVEYGALSAADLDRTLFYFREIDGSCDAVYQAETAQHRQRLEALKTRILSRPGAHVRTYHVRLGEGYAQSMTAFAGMVTEDLCALLHREWEENARLDAYALDQKKHWNLLEGKRAQFLSRDGLLSACLEHMRSAGARILLRGASGSGKSTLLSRIGDEMRQAGQVAVPVFCGYTPLCSSGFDVLRYMVWELERLLCLPHFADTAGKHRSSPAVWLEHIDRLLEQYEASGLPELAFLIDGLDQLIQDDIARELAFIPRRKDGRIRFVVSTTSMDTEVMDFRQIDVGDLSLPERRQVIRGILRTRHRELAAAAIEHLAGKESARLPLYLSLVLQRLLMMSYEDFRHIAATGDGMNAITAYQMRLIDACPKGLEDMSAYILDHASRQIGGASMLEAATLLAVSRRGLRLTDLEGLMHGRGMEWKPLDAAAFIQYMGPSFIHRSDGRIDFAHKSIRQGFLLRCGNVQPLHRVLAKWMLELPENDEVRVQELVWHLIQADMKEEFADTIALMTHDNINLTGITKDAVDAVMSDGGAWITEVVKEVFAQNSFPHLTHFIEFHIMFNIVNNRANLDIKRRLGELMLEAVQKRCAIHETFGGIWEISVACDRLAGIHRQYETRDHLLFAQKCSKQSLMIRKQLLNMMAELNTEEKQRRHWLNELQASGTRIQQTPSAEQLQGLTDGFISELRRGVCVVSEDMAAALESGDIEEQFEALKYLQDSLRMREEIYRTKGDHVFIEDDEVELARIYGRAVQVCLSLKDDKYLRLAGKYCARAMQVSENSLKKGATPERLEGWCAACVSLSTWQKTQPGGIAMALKTCLKCLPVLEKLDLQARSVQSQTNLADVCSRIGDLYSAQGDRARAEQFYRRSKGLVQDVAARHSSLAAERNVVVLNQRLIQEAHIDPDEGLDPAMSQLIRASFSKAQEIFVQMRSPEACDHLKELYSEMIRMFEEAKHLDDTVRKRILTELKVCLLENRLLVQNQDDDDLRHAVIKLAELAETLHSAQDSTLQSIPLPLQELLTGIGITSQRLTESHAKRACQLIRLALQVSDDLVQRTGERADRDILAVTLAKASMIFLTGSPEEWPKINERMRVTALELMRETGDEKYTQMVAMAEIGRQFASMRREASGPASAPRSDRPIEKKAPAESDEISILRRKIEQLTAEKDSLTGLHTLAARLRLDRQIKSLQQQLNQLLGDA